MLKSETTPLALRAYAALSIGVNVLGFLLMPLGHLVLRVAGIRKALVTPEMDAMLFIASSTTADGTACWYVSDMLAFPPGRGAGRRLLEALCEQADRDGRWLTLNASNHDLATKFYVPLGFVVIPGDEAKTRPRMVRKPSAQGLAAG